MPVRISVVTPSYNQARFLEETLRSVISQREHIHEYFVLDGGSNDGSVELIQKYADQIDWWVSEKDKGQSDAIHRGFSRATGDYLFWLNSDDVLLPGAMAKVVAALNAHPDWDALTGYHIRMDQDSRVISLHQIPGESAEAARWGIYHVCQQTCFFRRSIYEQLGGLDLSLHCVMDTELWCRMWARKTRWGHIPEYLAGFRQHNDAKGTSDKWMRMYQKEEADLRVQYPQYCARTAKHRLGLFSYRLAQIFSGRHPRALRQTRRLKGRTLQEAARALHLG